MTYFEYDRAILNAQEQYKFAAQELTKLVLDPYGHSKAVQLAKAVLNKMECNLTELTKEFNAKY